MLALVQVFQRKIIAGGSHGAAIGINHIELQATELRTLAAVGTTTKTMLRGIAQARVTDTKGTMNKDLQLRLGHLRVYLGNLVNREFAGQNHPLEPQSADPAHLVGRAVVGLCAGMNGEPCLTGHLHHGHILHQHGIDLGISQLAEQMARVVQLFVVDNGVDGDIDLGTIDMGIVGQSLDVVDAVARCRPCTKAGCSNIYGIGTMVDGGDTTWEVLGGCKQFEGAHRWLGAIQSC